MSTANKVWIWSEQLRSDNFNSGTWHEYWEVGHREYVRVDDGFKIKTFYQQKWVISQTEPDGPPEGPVGQKIELQWKSELVFHTITSQNYRPQDPGDLAEAACEYSPDSIKVTCIHASGIQKYRCSYCEAWSNDSGFGLCKGCGHSDWQEWDNDKYEVGYSYTL